MKNGKDANPWESARRLREARRNTERLNSLMRYRREVAVSVASDAKRIWNEIWDACLDPTPPGQIIRGAKASDCVRDLPSGGWSEFREKLHLLGHYLDYSFRILEADATEPDDDKAGSGIKTPQ